MKDYVKINKTGGLHIPIKLRRELNINNGDAVVIEPVEGGGIKVLPYRPSCVFCGAQEHIRELNGKGCCEECYEKLTQTEVMV